MSKKIGQLIKERVEAKNMDVTAFAKAVGTERSNAYNIFSRDSIDTALLKKIGQVLKYDFFQDLLEPETKREMLIRSSISNKVLVEIELQEDEMMKIGFKEKVVQVMNR